MEQIFVFMMQTRMCQWCVMRLVMHQIRFTLETQLSSLQTIRGHLAKLIMLQWTVDLQVEVFFVVSFIISNRNE